MDVNDLIRVSLLFLNAPDDDSELVERMREQGYSLYEAERCAAFMPIAFGRVLISQIGKVNFSPKYQTSESGKEYCLEDEPVYQLSTELALKTFQSGVLSRTIFGTVAARGAEVGILNQVLDQGLDISGVKSSPILLFGYETIDHHSSR